MFAPINSLSLSLIEWIGIGELFLEERARIWQKVAYCNV